MTAKWEACKCVQHAPLDLGSWEALQRSYDVRTHTSSNFAMDRVAAPEDKIKLCTSAI